VLEHEGRTVEPPLVPRMLAGDMEVLLGAVTAGLGIGLLPAFLCVGALRAGQLERVLSEWQAPATPMHVVYPSARHISAKVKTFVDHLQKRMTPPPPGRSSVRYRDCGRGSLTERRLRPLTARSCSRQPTRRR